MYIKWLRIEGPAMLEHLEDEVPGRVVRLGGDSARQAALLQCLGLALSAFSLEETRQMALRLGFGEKTLVEGEQGVDVIVVGEPSVARAWMGERRNLQVQLRLALDPPQYGLLRQAAFKDPELVAGLGAGADFDVTVGWAFDRQCTTVSVGVLRLEVGGVPVSLAERPFWVNGFLKGLVGRGCLRGPLEVDVVTQARSERSESPLRRQAAARVIESLKHSPFLMGELGVVGEQHLWLGVQQGHGLIPLPLLGADTIDSVRLAQAIHLNGAEIVLLEHPLSLVGNPSAVQMWLEARAEGAEATVEQIWLSGAPEPHWVL